MNATTLASLSETTYDNIDTIHTEKDMESDDGSFSQSMLTFAAIMTLMIMIVGIIGNFLTVAALIKCPKVRNVAAAFIMSLCIADLLFCALVLPFSAYRFIEGTWEPRDILCKMIPFIQYGNIGVSLLCIAMITINRYIMITHHNSYAKIYKKHWIAAMIIFCWVFSYGMQLPTLVGAWGTFGYDPKLGTCSILSDDHGHSSKTTLFVTAFVIPCCIIIACYTKIFWVVHKSEQRMKRHANKQNSIPNNLRPPPGQSSQSGGSGGFGTLPSGNNLETGGGGAGTQSRMSSDSSSSYSTDVKHETVATTPKQTIRIKDQREVRARRNEWRITKMVLAIFLSFVICYLPITIAKVADQHVEHPNFHILSYIMLYLSACLNPIIYVIMNKQYRKAYKTVIMCQPSKFISGFVKHGNVGAAGGGGAGRGAAAGGGGIAKNGSSAAEKWKDIGLSQTHSQTMVSRMSAGDVLPTTISYSSSNTQPMEQPTAAAMQTMEMSVNIPQLPAPPPPPPPSVIMASSIDNKAAVAEKILNTEKAGVSTVSSNTNTPTVATLTTTPTPMTTTKLNGSNNNLAMKNTRITLVGGDIILEEEEDQEEQEMQQQLQKQITTTAIIEAAQQQQQQQLKQNRPALPPQIQPKPQPQPRPAVPVYVNASALHQQKKSPYYGQNINVTAADNNNSMLTASSSAAANNSSAANSKLVTKQKL